MKAHIVFAHPNLQSYNGLLRNTAIQTLEAFGWSVTVSDLYQMKFKASADEDDFTSLYNEDFFDLQVEQQTATQRKTYSADIVREHQLLSDTDLIIFQFPLWWYSMPALLKGYIDRVFSMGWAYGGGQALVGKKILVSMTTGAPDFAWTAEKRGTIIDIFKHLFVGTFGLCGLENLEPFIVYGAKRHSETDKKTNFEKYKKRLTMIVE
ncbi:NAD(P)H-dependent oxidoreductase [Flavobacterium sp.]|jgi:NAD(P)H dehydrogenase (quinone)|uniref:NAD(P)H-dependent oxidoreductase n=1 Tax=Flavobacterium sp. TaxID=239 RepID=UPI0022C78E97|nr:NAD(P)H-dependent oxidoreductase [Flavobacterium sp.]MCZ8298397.1 NAD(P)H-dependent oxidoreductase [Flavobacterium sp.]